MDSLQRTLNDSILDHWPIPIRGEDGREVFASVYLLYQPSSIIRHATPASRARTAALSCKSGQSWDCRAVVFARRISHLLGRMGLSLACLDAIWSPSRLDQGATTILITEPQ
jgi:hypothetical protein